MNNRPLLGNNIAPLGDEYLKTLATNSSERNTALATTASGSQTLVDLRSTVATRFMRMLRAHDRTRQETLAAYSAQASVKL